MTIDRWESWELADRFEYTVSETELIMATLDGQLQSSTSLVSGVMSEVFRSQGRTPKTAADFSIDRIKCDAIAALKGHISTPRISVSEKKKRIEKAKKSITNLIEALDQCEEAGIHFRAWASLHKIEQDPFENAHIVDHVLDALEDVITEPESILENDHLPFASSIDPHKRRFVSEMMIHYYVETGKTPSLYSDGRAADFIRVTWNPVAEYSQKVLGIQRAKFPSNEAVIQEMKAVMNEPEDD